MSELFNEAFGKVFTKERLKDIPEAKWAVSGKGDLGLGDISFDAETVLQKLEKLRDDKAAGADELVPRFLNLIKQELACPLTLTLTLTIMSSVGGAFNAQIQSVRHLSSLLLNTVTDVESTTSCGKVFQILTTLRLKKFFRTSSRERCTDNFKL